jgi:hypothetical protein
MHCILYNAFMTTLTIRGVPPAVAKALEREKRRRNQSLNQTVLDALAAGLGVDPSGERRNGLATLAGTWSSDQLDEFEKAVAPSEQIDHELWR